MQRMVLTELKAKKKAMGLERKHRQLLVWFMLME